MIKKIFSLLALCKLFFFVEFPTLTAQSIQWQTSISDVSTFCSPRAIDLNQDGIKDIVLGAGIEGEASPSGIFAFNGANGEVLWQRYARDQMYGSPIFQDINQDSVPDVFITGRDAQFYALDGKTGFAIWEFWPENKGIAADSGWYNFYLPQWIPDQNQDGFMDIIVTNGGDATAPPPEKNRPPGYLMALSGKDGSILQVDTMKDGRETYHSPLLVDFFQNSDLHILFGSGGETVGGTYWRISLDEFLLNGLTNAKALLTNNIEGYIAVPSIADLNHNGVPDMIIPQLNANIIALGGASGKELWRHTEPGTDCYVSPAIGQFTGDPTPDVFVLCAEGNWPFYQKSTKLLLDGSNGQLVWSEEGYPFQMTNGIAIDWDQDGFDEIIYPRNEDIGDTARHLTNQFFLYDFNDQEITPFDIRRDGVINFSAPLVTDLDNDQSLEMIFVTHDNISDWYQPDGFTIYRMNLNTFRDEIAWGGYLGTEGDGLYPYAFQVSVSPALGNASIQVYPNPVNQTLFFRFDDFRIIDRIGIYDELGKLIKTCSHQNEIYVGDLSPGVYYYQVKKGKDSARGRMMKVE